LALAIGVFDGMHVGHQAVLHAAARLARREGWLSAALSFDGPPEAVLGQPVPPRLGHPDDDAAQMQGLGLGLLLRVPFTKALGRLKAEDFIERILKRRLRAAAVVVGHGFRFGRGAKGDVALLRRSGLRVVEIAPLKRGGHLVSSTRLRHAVQSGHLADASKLLGRPWRLRAQVVPGRGLGRTIGFPTANLAGPQAVLPLHGVWAGRCRVLTARGPLRWQVFAANIGVRPTVEAKGAVSVELHLIGFKGRLNGKTVEAEFHRFLRGERKFSGLPALVAQIQRDVVRAKKTMHGKLA
jgi:riboflavin kinase/FMN adenylyltransferase